MNTLIIEDEQLASDRLKRLIEKHYPHYQVVDQLDTVRDSVSLLSSSPNLDLIFCDIHLADGNSFEIFEQLKVDTPVIFTTAFDEYSIKAYDVNNIHYLLKPIDENDLIKAIKKFENTRSKEPSIEDVVKHLTEEKNRRFLLRSGQRFIPKKEKELAMFFIHNKVVHATDLSEGKVFMTDFSLEQLENELLPKRQFFRINRKQIVNKEAIASLRPYKNQRLSLSLAIPSSQELILSREKVNTFKAWFAE